MSQHAFFGCSVLTDFMQLYRECYAMNCSQRLYASVKRCAKFEGIYKGSQISCGSLPFAFLQKTQKKIFAFCLFLKNSKKNFLHFAFLQKIVKKNFCFLPFSKKWCKKIFIFCLPAFLMENSILQRKKNFFHPLVKTL